MTKKKMKTNIKYLSIIFLILLFATNNSWGMEELEEVPKQKCVVTVQETADTGDHPEISQYPPPDCHVLNGEYYNPWTCPDCKKRKEILQKNKRLKQENQNQGKKKDKNRDKMQDKMKKKSRRLDVK